MRRAIQVLFLVLDALASSLDREVRNVEYDSEYQGLDTEQPPENVKCRCVPFFLCDKVTGYIITDGFDIIKPRVMDTPECSCGKCPKEDQGDICCLEPPGFEGDDHDLSWDKCGANVYDDWARVMTLDSESSQTRFAEFPWTLMLMKAQQLPDGTWRRNVFQAGGSIIHRQIALTVAHVVHGVNETLLTVRAGEWNAASSTEEAVHQDRGVKMVIIHPGFNKGTMHNDIALLMLDKPFEIAINVAPICLPTASTNYDATTCLATGWGRNAFGSAGRYQTTMRKVDLPIVPDAYCQSVLRKTGLGPDFRLHRSFLCAGGKKGRDTCQGDGGGPLVCRTDDKYVQIGIVSWGVKCGGAYPAIYTKVSQFRNWIDSIISAITE